MKITKKQLQKLVTEAVLRENFWDNNPIEDATEPGPSSIEALKDNYETTLTGVVNVLNVAPHGRAKLVEILKDAMEASYMMGLNVGPGDPGAEDS